MKAKGKIVVHVLTITLLVFLLALSSTAYADPVAAQKITPQQSTPQRTHSVTGVTPAIVKYDPLPKGTITFTPASIAGVNASNWYIGNYEQIVWTCNGTLSNEVDVTLWLNNSKVFIIGTAIATGQTALTVPNKLSAGNYELRITNKQDPRVEARKPVTIFYPSITITAPKFNDVLSLGGPYKITWTYIGDATRYQLRFDLIGTDPRYFFPGMPGSISSVSMAQGQGSAVWTLPTQLNCIGVPGIAFTVRITLSEVGHEAARSALFGLSCGSNLANCGGTCTNHQTDVLNCGTCGKKCFGDASKSFCDKGVCKCSPGFTQCSGSKNYYCANLTTDSGNCGACGSACFKGGTCLNGKCVCQSPYGGPGTMCGDQCVDLQTNIYNCGACGRGCSTDPGRYGWCSRGQCI